MIHLARLIRYLIGEGKPIRAGCDWCSSEAVTRKNDTNLCTECAEEEEE